MLRSVTIAFIFVVLFSTALVAVQAANFTLFVSCIENPSESGLPRIWFGYEASETISGAADYGPSTTAGFIGYPPNILQQGRFDKVFAVEIQVEGTQAFFEFIADNGDSLSLFADATTEAPSCDSLDNEWHPDAPSIYIPMTSDCAFIEIQDDYGNWSQVTSNGEPVLLHYGQALIGSNGQPTDPARYRVTETACF